MNSPWWAILVAGICSALAAVTKPVYFFLYAPTAVGIFLFLWPQWRKARYWQYCFWLGLPPAWQPCYVRNYMIWGEPVFSPQGGSQLYLFVRPRLLEADGPVRDEANLLSGGYRDSRVPPTKEAWEQKFGSSWDNLAKRTRVYGQLAVDDIKQHAARFIKQWALAQMKLYGGTGTVTVSRIVEPSRAQQEAPAGFAAAWEELWKSGWWIYQVISWLLLAIIYLGALAGVVAFNSPQAIRGAIHSPDVSGVLCLHRDALAVDPLPVTDDEFVCDAGGLHGGRAHESNGNALVAGPHRSERMTRCEQ